MNNKRREGYTILNEVLSKNNMTNEVRNARYGNDVDDTLIKCISIICPDVNYELSRGKDIRDIVDWLKKYTDYGMEYFTEYSKRVEKESKAIIHNLEYNKKVELLDLQRVEMLPYDIKKTILDYIPFKEKGLTIMSHDWVDMEEELKKMKGSYLNKIISNIKKEGRLSPSIRSMSNENFHPQVTYESIRSVNYLIDDYTYNLRKELKVEWLKKYIDACLMIDMRSKKYKYVVTRNGYRTILLLKYLIIKNQEEREENLMDRKERKKIKRRERIRMAKENNKLEESSG